MNADKTSCLQFLDRFSLDCSLLGVKLFEIMVDNEFRAESKSGKTVQQSDDFVIEDFANPLWELPALEKARQNEGVNYLRQVNEGFRWVMAIPWCPGKSGS